MSKRQVDDAPDGGPEPVQKEAKMKANADLEHVYSTVDTSNKSQRLFTEQNVTDITTLLDKVDELGRAALPNINKSTQKQLHNFCLWFQDFYKKNSDDTDWKPHFDEDSLAQFESDRFRAALDTSNNSGGLLEDNLELVCDELDMPKRTRQQLAELGITSVKELLAKKTDLELFSLSNVKKTTQKALLKICLWHEDFYRKNDDTVPWQKHFNDESFATFEQEPSVERDYRMALERIHEGRCDGGISKVSDDMISYAATITTRYLSKQLVDQCRKKFSPFDVAVKCHKALMHPRGAPDETIHLVSGKTQSGKSTVKAVCAAVHRQLSCLLIVITKGVPERDDLKIKLNNLLGGCRETMEAGLLVIADTGGQIAKATTAVLKIREDLPHARFGVIVDECDAMYRTKDGAQIMEQRYAALMDLGPSFRMEISATIYSALQALDEQGKKVEMMEIFTTDDYSGINEMRHVKDANAKDVFLNLQDLGPREGVKYVAGGPTPVNNQTPLLFTDAYEVNRKCNSCKGAKGCELHSDIVSKRSWAICNQSFIPYTSQPMMDMLDQMLPPSQSMDKAEHTVGTREELNQHTDEQYPPASSDGSGNDSDMVVTVSQEDDAAALEKTTCDTHEKESTLATDATECMEVKEDTETMTHVKVTASDPEKCTEAQEGLEKASAVAVGDTKEKEQGLNALMETEDNEKVPAKEVTTTLSVQEAEKPDEAEPEETDARKALNHAQHSSRKGLLALVATNPRVYADGNVVVQAACVQNYFRGIGKDFVAVVATGVGVYFRFPGHKKARFIRRSLKTVSEIIERIDKAVGLETPVVIFGYSRMCRCVSFRSSARVPTHMILSRGPGYSLEDYIQALGRATFNGLSVLQQNGHSQVTILTDENDFLAAKKYYSFVQEVNGKMSKNPEISLVEALGCATKKLPDEANFFRHTNRKVGRRKDLKHKVPGRDAFEEPSNLEDMENKKNRYRDDKMAQRVMKIFLEMADGDDSFGCCTDELVAAYQEAYPPQDDDDTGMGKTTLKKIMTNLAKDVIFEKVKQEGENEHVWSAKSLFALESVLNENLEEPEDRDDANWAAMADED